VLFDPHAHEPLLDVTWSAAKAEATIREIARDADEAMRPGEWWPWHPLDLQPDDPAVVHGIYIGAAGVLWALDQLARAGLHEPRHSYARLAGDAYDSYLDRPESTARCRACGWGRVGSHCSPGCWPRRRRAPTASPS
jgi:hypothetical protein